MLPQFTIESPRRKRFTRAELQRITDLGLLNGQRLELIDGDLIDKMGQNPPHAFVIGLILSWFTRILGIERLRCQLPIEVSREDQERSFPEPDIAVLVEPKSEYGTRHPRGDELLIIVEIAETSWQLDLTVKAGVYARAGVPEYWVLDIGHRWLIIHRHPLDGEYRQVTRLGENETVSFNYGCEHSVLISDLMPARVS